MRLFNCRHELFSLAAILRLESFAAENMVLIGMRGTVNDKEYWDFVENEGMTCFGMRQILDLGLNNVIN